MFDFFLVSTINAVLAGLNVAMAVVLLQEILDPAGINVSTRKHGGLRFVRVGRLNFSFSISRRR